MVEIRTLDTNFLLMPLHCVRLSAAGYTWVAMIANDVHTAWWAWFQILASFPSYLRSALYNILSVVLTQSVDQNIMKFVSHNILYYFCIILRSKYFISWKVVQRNYHSTLWPFCASSWQAVMCVVMAIWKMSWQLNLQNSFIQTLR